MTAARGPARFLALGDSYTIGESVTAAERWPVQLARLLKAEGIEVQDPEIIAVSGWTTAELWAGMDQAAPQGPYDLVSLLIGVNNQYRGLSEQEYAGEFTRLLGRAIDLAGGRSAHVLVLSIPDWGVTPFAQGRDRKDIAQQIDWFNTLNRRVSEPRGVNYVDVTAFSRLAANDPSLIAPDGLHPSAKMYAEWARLALPLAREVLTT